MIAYKVVRFEVSNMTYCSLHRKPEHTVLTYNKNNVTTPCAGPVFAFKSIAQAKLYKAKMYFIQKPRKILYVSGEPYSYNLNAVNRVIDLNFWDDPEGNLNEFTENQLFSPIVFPVGTVLLKSVKVLAVV